jgi:SAM-dependent methyltransferase
MSQNISPRVCSICGNTRHKTIFKQHFSTMSDGSLLNGYDVVVCQQCGFCFADNIPDQVAFDLYYREMSKYENQTSMGQGSKYDLVRFQTVVSIVKPFLPDTNACILEIGSSTGTFLSLLKENGYKNVTGVDPSPLCAEIANRLYGIKILTNTMSDISVDNGSIDFLILAGVMEHFRDLNSAISRLWNMLSVGGRIYVAVPDASRYAEGEDAPYQEFSVEHINFFGPDSLTNLMEVNGFIKLSVEQGILEANYRTTTPVVHGIFKKSLTKDKPVISYDKETEKGLQRFIEKSRLVDDQIKDTIAKLVSDDKPIIVWGTGAHTLRLLATSKLGEAKIRAFVDSNPRYQGKTINNIPIISPQALMGLSNPTLISSRIYQKEIVERIQSDIQIANEIITLY